MNAWGISLIAICAMATPAAAQEADWFERAEGHWRAEGRSFGLPSVTEMQWSESLGGQFQRLDYRIEMTTPDGGTSMFEGIAHYRMQDTGIEAYWAGSTGDLHPIVATSEDGTLTSHWGRNGGKQGRSEYRLTETGMTVTDWLLTAEGWREFNRTEFTRTAD